MTISLIVASLVALNFLLLGFSCNKTSKKEAVNVKTVKQVPDIVTSQLESHQLAPTGS